MKDHVTITGVQMAHPAATFADVVLTRAQVEAALKELNTPSFKPGDRVLVGSDAHKGVIVAASTADMRRSRETAPNSLWVCLLEWGLLQFWAASSLRKDI